MTKPSEIAGLGPKTPLRDLAPLLLATHLGDLERKLPSPGEPAVDDVHDARVAARRLRVALDHLGDGVLDREERAVKKLQDALGSVRDAQLETEWLESREARAGGEAAQALLALEREKLSASKRDLELALGIWNEKTAPRLARKIDRPAPAGRLGGKRMRRRLDRAIGRADAAAAELGPELEARRVHRLRIQAKKLRYLAELVRPGFPDRVDALLERLVPLQDAIGELHDVDARLGLFSDFAASSSDAVRTRLLPLQKQVEASRETKADAARRALGAWRGLALARAA